MPVRLSGTNTGVCRFFVRSGDWPFSVFTSIWRAVTMPTMSCRSRRTTG